MLTWLLSMIFARFNIYRASGGPAPMVSSKERNCTLLGPEASKTKRMHWKASHHTRRTYQYDRMGLHAIIYGIQPILPFANSSLVSYYGRLVDIHGHV